MIKNNFNELMAQKKLKITRVFNDTGISRPTLTSLSRNGGKGIQYDTLNILCNYFNITPCEFFDYIPYEFEINIVPHEDRNTSGFVYINIFNSKKEKINTYELYVAIYKDYDEKTVIKGDIELTDDEVDRDFLNFLKETFTPSWRQTILDYIDDCILLYFENNHSEYEQFAITNYLKKYI